MMQIFRLIQLWISSLAQFRNTAYVIEPLFIESM